jgi:hypothetical protein
VGKNKRSTPQKQTLILWALLARDQAASFQNELKPEPDKVDREALEKAGLIRSEKKGRHRKVWIEVTERGWAWAADHLDHELPTGSPAGSAILQAWLTHLKCYMSAHNVILAEILGSQRASKPERTPGNKTIPPHDYEQLRLRIRKTYLDLTGQRMNTRARLSDVRERLRDVDPTALNEALKRMQREQEVALYPLDNKAEITDADRSAAIYFAGEPRHILWIER